MTHIFISYKHEDGDFAANLRQQLEAEGFIVWIDINKLRAGEDWRVAIDNAIRGSFVVIVILTPAAKASEYVTYEWSYALGLGVHVLPVMLKQTDAHPRMQVLQYLDFTDQLRRPWDELYYQLREVQKQYVPPTLVESLNVPPMIRESIDLLSSANAEERRSAIYRLAQYPHQAARAALTEQIILNDDDWQVRLAGIEVLADMVTDHRAPEGIVRAVSADRVSYVREAAIRALGRIGDPSTIPILLRVLQERPQVSLSQFSSFLRDDDYDRDYLRQAAQEALGMMGQIGEDTLGMLVEMFNDPNNSLRWEAADALVYAGEAALTHLTAALSDPDPQVRYHALGAITEIGATRLNPAVLELLRDRDNDVRQAAVRALGAVQDPATLPTLLDVLKDRDPEMRSWAVQAIGRIGDTSAVPALLNVLRDPDYTVRIQGVQALAQLATPAYAEQLIGLLDWVAARSGYLVDWGGSAAPDTFMNLVTIIKKAATPMTLPRLHAYFDDLLTLRMVYEGDPDVLTARVDMARIRDVVQERGTTLETVLKDLYVPADNVRQARSLLEPGNISNYSEDLLAKIVALDPTWLRTAGVPRLLHRLSLTERDIIERYLPDWALLYSGYTYSDRRQMLVPQIVVYALDAIGDTASVPALIQAAEAFDPDLRGRAVIALGNLGDARAVPVLTELLDDTTTFSYLHTETDGLSDEEGLFGYYVSEIAGVVQECAIQALGQIRSYDAIPALVEAALASNNLDYDTLLGQTLLHHESPQIVRECIDRLKRKILMVSPREAPEHLFEPINHYISRAIIQRFIADIPTLAEHAMTLLRWRLEALANLPQDALIALASFVSNIDKTFVNSLGADSQAGREVIIQAILTHIPQPTVDTFIALVREHLDDPEQINANEPIATLELIGETWPDEIDAIDDRLNAIIENDSPPPYVTDNPLGDIPAMAEHALALLRWRLEALANPPQEALSALTPWFAFIDKIDLSDKEFKAAFNSVMEDELKTWAEDYKNDPDADIRVWLSLIPQPTIDAFVSLVGPHLTDLDTDDPVVIFNTTEKIHEAKEIVARIEAINNDRSKQPPSAEQMDALTTLMLGLIPLLAEDDETAVIDYLREHVPFGLDFFRRDVDAVDWVAHLEAVITSLPIDTVDDLLDAIYSRAENDLFGYDIGDLLELGQFLLQCGTLASVPYFTALLTSSVPKLRALGACALLQADDRSLASHLVPLLRDAVTDIRRVAAAALDQMSWQPPDDRLRIAFYTAYENWDQCVVMGEKAVPYLLEMLASDREITAEIIDILQEIQDERALPDMIRLALAHPDADVRKQAEQAVTQISRGRALEPVYMHLLADAEPEMWRPLVAGLAGADVAYHAEVIQHLAQQMPNRSGEDQWFILQTVATLGTSSALPLLQEFIDHEQPWMRAAVAQALAEIDDRAALELLFSMLRDRSPTIRHTAAYTLIEKSPALQVKWDDHKQRGWITAGLGRWDLCLNDGVDAADALAYIAAHDATAYAKQAAETLKQLQERA